MDLEAWEIRIAFSFLAFFDGVWSLVGLGRWTGALDIRTLDDNFSKTRECDVSKTSGVS